MLVISILSDDLCLHQKIRKNVIGRAIFVIAVVEHWAAFYSIYERQHVLAALDRPIWIWITLIEK